MACRIPYSLLLLGLASCASAQCDFAPVEQAVNALVAQYPSIPGVGVVIVKGDQTLYKRYWKSYSDSTVVPIASATKTLSGALLMALADRGQFDLDQPVGSLYPEFTGQKATMTPRWMFSHTSGLPGSSAYVGDNSLTLQQAARLIGLNTPLQDPPRSVFRYGGVSMHVAGAMAELRAGSPWETLFADRIAVPLGLTNTDYEFQGPTDNPRIAGGARSTVPDLTRFTQMLKDRGLFQGRRILLAASVDEMLKDQVGGLPVVGTPFPGAGYGIGVWRPVVNGDGSIVEWAGAGAFGTWIWANMEQDYFLVFLTDFTNQLVQPTLFTITDYLRGEMARCTDTHPRWLQVGPGRLASGEVPEVKQSDDRSLVVSNGPVANPNSPPAQVTVEGTATKVAPSSIAVNIESKASLPGLVQMVEAFDFTAGQWLEIDRRSAPLVDTAFSVPLTTPARFVRPTDRLVRLRVNWRPAGPLASSQWSGSLDKANWTVR